MRIAAIVLGVGSGLLLLFVTGARLAQPASDELLGLQVEGTNEFLAPKVILSVVAIVAAATLPKHPLVGGVVLVCCTGVMLFLFVPGDPAWLLIGVPAAAGIIAIAQCVMRHVDPS
jgi:hypothetical protein